MPNAVIDIGTNTVILLVAESSKKGLKVIHDEAVITRLGQGLSENHFFLSDAMKRTQDVLARFVETTKKLQVDTLEVVGTAAFRNAANAEVFRNKVKLELGLTIEVISGDDEAAYVFRAALEDFGKQAEKLIVVDIGGGSTEVITGPKKDGPETLISLPIGSVRLTEEFVHSDPIIDDEYARLMKVIRNGVADNLDDFYEDAFTTEGAVLIATAGTATTLAALNQKMADYRAEAIHGTTLTKADLEDLITDLAGKSVNERQKMPGLEPLRADVILAGAILLHALMTYFKKTEALISDRGLRYGVWFDKFGK